MHEHAMIHALFHKLEEISITNGHARIKAVEIWLGALCHISPDHFREHFEFEGRGTPAEGALLTLETSDQLDHPNTQDIVLKNLTLELPDTPEQD